MKEMKRELRNATKSEACAEWVGFALGAAIYGTLIHYGYVQGVSGALGVLKFLVMLRLSLILLAIVTTCITTEPIIKRAFDCVIPKELSILSDILIASAFAWFGDYMYATSMVFSGIFYLAVRDISKKRYLEGK